VSVYIREATDVDRQTRKLRVEDPDHPQVVRLNGVHPLLGGHGDRPPDLREEIVPGGRIRGEVDLAPRPPAVADPGPQILKPLQEIRLVVPAERISQVDGIVRTEIRRHQIFHIGDTGVQLKGTVHGSPFTVQG